MLTAQERHKQIQAQNDTKGTFFRVDYPADDSTLDTTIDVACSNMSEVNVNKVTFNPDMRASTPLMGDMAASMDFLIDMIDLELNTIRF